VPIYDYKCPSCGSTRDDVFVHRHDVIIRCPKCTLTMIKLITTRVAVKCFPSEGVFLEHVGPKGRRFHSEKEMRQYAKKHDLELGALL
jgi:putative FmdB family regulatory protein